MKEVRIEKKKLVEILTRNRDEHVEIYARALAKYCRKVQKPLNAALKRATNNEPPKLHRLTRLIEPREHTAQYDTVLEMLKLSVDETVVLSHDAFRQYVEDEWVWSRAWAGSNSPYTSSPKFAKYVDEEE